MAVVLKILLGILILLLVMILLLLFFPFSYQIQGRKNSDGLFVSAKVKWLFGFVRMLFDYPEPNTPILKLAFFTLLGKKKNKKAKDDKAKPLSESEGYKPSDENSKPSEVKSDGSLESSESSEAAEATEASENPESDDAKETSGEESSPKKEKVPINEKLSKLKSDFIFYKELWEDGNTKPLLKAVLARVFHVLKNLLPRKIHGKLIFGAATPDTTGYVYGGYVVLRTLYPKRLFLELTPDFEKQILEGELLIKGHFSIFTIVWDGLRILFDKRLKILRRKLKERSEKEPSEGQAPVEKQDKKKKNHKKNRNKKNKKNE